MGGRPPVDSAALAGLFDPFEVARRMTPTTWVAAFGTTPPSPFDPEALHRAWAQGIEAMAEANRASAAAFGGLMAQQDGVTEKMRAAFELQAGWMAQAAGPDALQRQAAAAEMAMSAGAAMWAVWSGAATDEITEEDIPQDGPV